MDRQSRQVTWLSMAGYVAAGACLIWLFHDVSPKRVLEHMRGIRWQWVSLAVLADVSSYCFQGWRWALLLRPLGNLTELKATESIYIGLFANEILPLRVGEAVRAFLAARWLRAKFSQILPSLILERLFDGVWLTAAIGLSAVFVPLPSGVAEAADVLGVVVLSGVLALVIILARKPGGASGRIPTLLRDLRAALRAVGARAGTRSFAISSLILVAQASAFWLVMVACGLRVSFFAGAVVFLIVRLGTMIPAAPANVGTYQFFVVVGLGIFGVDKTLATGFSMIVFLLLTLPLWIIGMIALAHNGLTLATIRSNLVEGAVEDADEGATTSGRARTIVPN